MNKVEEAIRLIEIDEKAKPFSTRLMINTCLTNCCLELT
jgi:hypothetical protein